MSGCGKSHVGERIARQLGLPMIEGDDFHSTANVEKMRSGVPLTDADRAGWLARLGQELAARPAGAVLACSALKKAYRDVLRGAVPGLTFVYLELSLAEAQRRAASRPGHFYPPSLVPSQFEALEDPSGEPGVVVVDATRPITEVARHACEGLAAFNNP